MSDIKHLKYFIELSETLNFHEAAQRCGVTQPTLSAQIKLLERKLGLDLFHRTKRSVKLSPYGQLLLNKAKQVVLRHKTFTSYAEKLIKDTSLKCGLDNCIAPSIKKQLIKHLISENIAILENDDTSLDKDLNNLNLDLIISTSTKSQKQTDHIKVIQDPFYIIFPKNHYLSQFKESKQKLLLGESILILDEFRGSAPYTWLKKHKNKKELNNTHTLDSLLQFIENSGWLSILPKSYIASLPSSIGAIPITNTEWTHSIYIKFHKQSLQLDQFKKIASHLSFLYSEQTSLERDKPSFLVKEPHQTPKSQANSDTFDMP
ncbi:hypothetical protein DID80_00615 [Candidatus Marinamargulisbacteria bacterium SCGC AAA071-K20]|nr:hypothetical protein DID80_00615 [Candidatus Marinamargulisbacteria bacterium SCGC AAA071-K20]